MLTTNELAARLSVHPVTVRGWRVEGTGPAFVTVGRCSIRYRESDVDAWLAARERTSTATSVQPTRAA
jgi:excisionase family DNA binding protein